MNTARIFGIALILLGIAIYFLIPQPYGWISGAMWGAGLGLLLFFGPKNINVSREERKE